MANGIEEGGKKCEAPKIKPEIAETFNWSKEERQKLNESFLVENVKKKLIEKYPEQKCFFDNADIKIMELGKDIKEYNEVKGKLGTDVFLLFGTEGKLLSYLDQDGNTIFDISNFNFDDDFANLLGKKKLNKYIRKNEKGFLEYYYDGEIFPQGSPEFNTIISRLHIIGKLLYKKSR
ncbi:MAG: hypothetical protein PHR68_03135 [Candidatus Gracilibacteria bacterium]|nr:hypothetical protein [Candidatus Gracilibacteria bacterium]